MRERMLVSAYFMDPSSARGLHALGGRNAEEAVNGDSPFWIRLFDD